MIRAPGKEKDKDEAKEMTLSGKCFQPLNVDYLAYDRYGAFLLSRVMACASTTSPRMISLAVSIGRARDANFNTLTMTAYNKRSVEKL